MKKTTFLIFAVCAGLLFCAATALHAEDMLLASYEFTTGPDQLKSSDVTPGMIFDDIIVGTGSNPITATFADDALETTNWGTGMNISTGKCINIPLGKLASADEFQINAVKVTLKRDEAKKMQINWGDEANTFDHVVYNKPANLGTDEYTAFTLTTTEGPYAITPISDNGTRYLSIGTLASSTAKVVYIDKIEVWGTVSLITEPSIVSDQNSIAVRASQGSSYDFPVNLSGANLTASTQLSMVGTDAASFSVDVATVSAVDLNDGITTVTVSYVADEPTYDPATKTQHPLNAVLRIENEDITTIDIPVTATCDVLYEDFSNYDNTATSANALAKLVSMPDNVSLSLVSGWSGEHLYQYKAGSPNLGSVCLGSTSSDSAYLTTPELDLSRPFTVFAKVRSLVKNTDGRFQFFLDGKELIFEDTNTSDALQRKTSQAFVGTAASKLTFTGRMLDENQIVFDSIVVNYSSDPAVNIALNKTVDAGAVKQGHEKSINIPLQAYNLTDDVSLSLQNGTDFSIISGTTLTKTTAESGVNIGVQFTAPSTPGTYSDVLTVSTPGMNDRTILLTGTSDLGTGIRNSPSRFIRTDNRTVSLYGYAGRQLIVYSVTGVKLLVLPSVGDTETVLLPESGCYIVVTDDGLSRTSEKVIIK